MQPHPTSKNRTNGRILMAMLERVAPGWLERKALQAFMTPRRPRVPREPTVPGARHFEIECLGRRLAAWEWGAGPTVLLVHGWSGYGAQMQQFVSPLVALGFHVVTIDLPAHGQSSGTTLNLPELAEVLQALMGRLQPVAVVAHSFGGAALTYALSRGAKTDRVLLVAPPVEMGIFARRAVARAGLSSARADGMIHEIERRLGPLDQFDLRRVALSLKVPAAMIHDRSDDDVAFELVEQVAKAWATCQWVPTEGYGHLGHLKSPEVCQAAAEWVAGRELRAPRSVSLEKPAQPARVAPTADRLRQLPHH